MSFFESLFSLTGKTAIVTGASRGIGRSAAIALARAGANVMLVGRDKAALQVVHEEIAHLGAGKSHVAPLDVTNSVAMMETITETIQRWKTIDVLVNNAGIILRAPAEEFAASDWQDVINTNLTAVFSWAQAVGKVMLGQGRGKIINMASVLSFQGGVNVVAYTAAKGGVAQLTKALSNEWMGRGVHVNAIAPGYIETNATAALRVNAGRNEQILSRIPAGRWGTPDDIQGAILFLASPASDYVSGHVLVVDGGWLVS